MARWAPKKGDQVAASEPLGRRLFDRAPLKGAYDQTRLTDGYELHHFEESRDGEEFSVDRLGRTGVERAVRNYLVPRANASAAARRPETHFLGWAIISARACQKAPLKTIADPIPIEQGRSESDNDYHAHVCLPAESPLDMRAAYLRHLFEENLLFHSATGQEVKGRRKIDFQKPWYERLGRWISSRFRLRQ
jgi:hypothetical protein